MNEQLLTAETGATVLIVDDTPANIGVLRNMLQDAGYQIYAATSGPAALKIARNTRPDLILLDIMMPEMDGLETARRLKEMPETCEIPIIFVTARTDAQDIVTGFQAGAVDYIGKPIQHEEVCARVRTHIALRRQTTALREQAERFRAVVTSMAEGLLIVEPGGRIQFANAAAGGLLRYAGDALIGLSLQDILSEPSRQEYRACLSPGAGNGAENGAASGAPALPHGPREVTLNRRDGSTLALDLTLTPIFLAQPLYIALLHDISRHKEAESELLQLARIDPLTGIANRRHLDTVLTHEWQRAQRSGLPISMLVLDIDHFKLYNDHFGHPAGDRCLQQIAQVLQNAARRPTDLAARIGGEEFVLLFADTEQAAALLLAEKVRADIAQLQLPHPRSGTASFVTASIGVATLGAAERDVSELFLVADQALYRAKSLGRNRVEATQATDC